MPNYLPWINFFISIAIGAAIFIWLWKTTTQSQKSIEKFENNVRDELRKGREESRQVTQGLREEVSMGLKSITDTLGNRLDNFGSLQSSHFESVVRQLLAMSDSNRQVLEKLRNTIDSQIKQLQESNEKKLDEMRKTVDEKLQTTLEKRLGEAFNLVNQQLETVLRAVGEMQGLAAGVGDLKKALSNVKVRGVWGEMQLGAILEQILTPAQYEKNVPTKPTSKENVEFAIKLPGLGQEHDSEIWIPIDAKFPQEDYQRLVAASEIGDLEGIRKATEDLKKAVRKSAQAIQDKYIAPPHTTDFAIMFVPTEALYAEILRQPGLLEQLQQEFRVVLTGPTTLSAFLNSLSVGFRTLAIGKRASEVWQVLAAVKTEFHKFVDILNAIKKDLDTASNRIDSAQTRTRVMQRTLREVEQLPPDQSKELLGLHEIEQDETSFEDESPK